MPRINIEDYPAIKKHLDKFINELKNRYDKGDTPYNLRNCNYMDDFFKQKIIYSEIVQKPQFFLDNKQNFFPEATAFIMTGNDLELVIACLNSKLYSYSFKKFYSGGGLGESGFRYKKIFLEKLPLPILSKENKFYEQIKDLVLQINKENSQTEKDKLINKIDDLLYDLTQLNKKERRLINES